MTKTPLEFLAEAGVTAQEIAATHCDDPAIWDVEIVTAALADYDDPAVAARRATRSGPGLVRAAKITAARRAWLADQKQVVEPAAVAAESSPVATAATLESVAKASTTMEISFRVWRGRETRVYMKYAGRDRGYYTVDESRREFSAKNADRRGKVEPFEAALAEFLAAA